MLRLIQRSQIPCQDLETALGDYLQTLVAEAARWLEQASIPTLAPVFAKFEKSQTSVSDLQAPGKQTRARDEAEAAMNLFRLAVDLLDLDLLLPSAALPLASGVTPMNCKTLIGGVVAVFQLPSSHDREKKAVAEKLLAVLRSHRLSSSASVPQQLLLLEEAQKLVVPKMQSLILSRTQLDLLADRPSYSLFILAVDCLMEVSFLAVSLGRGSLTDYVRFEQAWVHEEHKQLRQLPVIMLARIAEANMGCFLTDRSSCINLCVLASLDPAILDSDLQPLATMVISFLSSSNAVHEFEWTAATSKDCDQVRYTARATMLALLLRQLVADKKDQAQKQLGRALLNMDVVIKKCRKGLAGQDEVGAFFGGFVGRLSY